MSSPPTFGRPLDSKVESTRFVRPVEHQALFGSGWREALRGRSEGLDARRSAMFVSIRGDCDYKIDDFEKATTDVDRRRGADSDRSSPAASRARLRNQPLVRARS
jgi:hypothetical protein